MKEKNQDIFGSAHLKKFAEDLHLVTRRSKEILRFLVKGLKEKDSKKEGNKTDEDKTTGRETRNRDCV